VTHKDAFQEKFRRLGALVDQLDAGPGGCSSESCRELIQLLMEVHGAALERMLEIVDQSGAQGEAIILKVGEDPIVRPLLVLYSLHPENLESRVLKALDAARQRLRKLNSDVELIEACEGTVKVRIRTAGHACGSTAKTAHSIVEECVYDFAPDLDALEIHEPEVDVAPGFVSIDSLLQRPATARPVVIEMQTTGAD
jgi:Fe-S cluster biogenesis protein NfuA